MIQSLPFRRSCVDACGWMILVTPSLCAWLQTCSAVPTPGGSCWWQGPVWTPPWQTPSTWTSCHGQNLDTNLESSPGPGLIIMYEEVVRRIATNPDLLKSVHTHARTRSVFRQKVRVQFQTRANMQEELVRRIATNPDLVKSAHTHTHVRTHVRTHIHTHTHRGTHTHIHARMHPPPPHNKTPHKVKNKTKPPPPKQQHHQQQQQRKLNKTTSTKTKHNMGPLNTGFVVVFAVLSKSASFFNHLCVWLQLQKATSQLCFRFLEHASTSNRNRRQLSLKFVCCLKTGFGLTMCACFVLSY